jgi:hypothetical protein
MRRVKRDENWETVKKREFEVYEFKWFKVCAQGKFD